MGGAKVLALGTVSLYLCFSVDLRSYAVLIHDVERAKMPERQLSSVFTLFVIHISSSVLLQGEQALSSQVALPHLPPATVPQQAPGDGSAAQLWCAPSSLLPGTWDPVLAFCRYCPPLLAEC